MVRANLRRQNNIMANDTVEKKDLAQDVEMGPKESSSAVMSDIGETKDQFQAPRSSFWVGLSSHGVEMRGAEPVPVEKRTDTRYVNVLTIFATSMTSLLP